MQSDKTVLKQKRTGSHLFQPGQSGNPKGCKKGSRHKATLAALALLEGETEQLTRKAVELALGGDMAALRLCIERLVPPAKDRPIRLDLPDISTATGVVDALNALLQSVAEGELTPVEGATLSGILEKKRAAIETMELEQRVALLEGKG